MRRIDAMRGAMALSNLRPAGKAFAALGMLASFARELGREDLVELVAGFSAGCEHEPPSPETFVRLAVVLELQAVRAVHDELREFLVECRHWLVLAAGDLPGGDVAGEVFCTLCDRAHAAGEGCGEWRPATEVEVVNGSRVRIVEVRESQREDVAPGTIGEVGSVGAVFVLVWLEPLERENQTLRQAKIGVPFEREQLEVDVRGPIVGVTRPGRI